MLYCPESCRVSPAVSIPGPEGENLVKKLLLLALLTVPVRAAASGPGAINMVFNTSARAAGMGETGVAVPWGGDTDHWANPALLAFRPGIQYRSFESRLARGLADDIFLYDKEMTFGARGVTVLLARGPLDGNYLDLGIQESTIEDQDQFDSFHAHAQTKSWGVGVDAVRAAEEILGWREGRFSRWVSVAGGITWHDFQDHLADSRFIQDDSGSGPGSGTSRSMGYLVRVTPYDGTRSLEARDDCAMGVRLSLAYGGSVLNRTDEFISRPEPGFQPFPRLYVSGWGLNAEVGFTRGLHEQRRGSVTGFFLTVIDPVFSFTRTYQNIEPGTVYDGEAETWRYEHDTSDVRDEKYHGWEMGFANIYFMRRGRVEVMSGEVDGETRGGGWNLQAGRYGGFRKDWATVPQTQGLPTVRRKTWTIWVDPVAIVDTLF